MIKRQTPGKNYDSYTVKHTANGIHNEETNPQNNFWHEKENATYYENGNGYWTISF